MKCYRNEPKQKKTVVDCEKTPVKGAKFCSKTTSGEQVSRACMNDASFMLQMKMFPKLKQADGCYDGEATVLGSRMTMVMCICSKDECNAAIRTSYSKTFALVPIIMIIKALDLAIF